MVCGKEAQYSEIIATSANQIVPPKFCGPTKMLYYIHQTPLFYCSVEGCVEGGSGDKTTSEMAQMTAEPPMEGMSNIPCRSGEDEGGVCMPPPAHSVDMLV